ncbi:MAG: STT3 domain-containing protein [Promethearchaeota archaeon]
MVKIIASIRNFRDRIRTSISVKITNILFFLAIFLIVILAIVIRCSPLIRGNLLIKAFDPWIQWYNAEYLNGHTLYEYFNWYDLKSWFPQGIYRGGLRPGLTFTVVIIHKIFEFFGLPVSLYYICFFFPAFMGGITILVMYYLGKEVHSRATGLFAAFFLAFNPGYLQRTTAGFFDNETIGVFATLMTFLFFLKAARTGKFVYSVIGGMSLGYLSLSWGGYQFVYLILPVISIVLVLTKKYNENLLIAYAGVQGTGLLVFSLYNKFKYIKIFTDLEIGGIFFFTIILVIFHILYTKKTEKPALYANFMKIIKWVIIPGILVFAIIVWLAPEVIPFGFGARFNTILSPLFRGNYALVASVAEQMPSAWSTFYYQTLIPLLLIPLGIFFCFKRLNAADILLIAFVLLMYYFTGSMIRIILLFAPAAALIGSYGLVSILKIFGSFLGEKKGGVSRKRRRQIKGTLGSSETLSVYISICFLCIAQVVHTTDIAIDQMSYGQMAPQGVIHDWEEALTWMKDNLKGTDVVVSWWDYGYWLTPIANVTTVNDNATKNATRIGLTGMALMQSNEIYSAKAFRRLRADYVLVYFGFLYSGLGGDEGKWTWMLQICNDHYAAYKKKGWEEDNWAANSVFDESEYYNESTGRYEDKWFQSQLVKLMFFNEPTNPDEAQHQFQENYAKQISSRTDDDGNLWITHIPEGGHYETISFTPVYFSKFGMVKLYKLDYTALDSRFVIKNAEVFDSGYGTFKLKNTGKKELQIRSVEINGEEYDFVMGNTSNTIKKGEEDVVWVDIKSKGTTFNENDVVSLNVTAESQGTLGRIYVFRNQTSNFFVKKAIQGELKINKENSNVIQVNPNTADVYLEVENIGDTIVVLDRFYLNNDTEGNRFDPDTIEYLSGSAVLEPGEKSYVYLPNASASFSPISKYNKVGVATPNNIFDEILLTSNIENYSISILSKLRIYSPEVLATLNTYFRKHIPIDFSQSYAYTYDNGSTILKIKIKNTGDTKFGLGSVYLTDSINKKLKEVKEADWKYEYLLLGPNEEEYLTISATGKNNIRNYTSGNLNEEILVCVTGSYGELGAVASDIGFIHTVKDGPDIQVLTNVEGYTSSFIYANETGKVLIKNTGNEPINLETIEVNGSSVNNVEYLYGDSSLNIQECAIVTFDIPGLMINKSDECILSITTNTTAETIKSLYAFVDSKYYNIEIDGGGTSAINPGSLTILIDNTGLFNVTVDSVYINGTYFSVDDFNELVFEIGAGDSLELTITIVDVGIGLGKIINDGDKLEILVRTIEGAEDTHTEVVK